MVNIANLTITSYYKICETQPLELDCGVCLAPLIPLVPAEPNTVVKTKVCDHYFHQDCIEAWFRSATPHLNVCPLDRLVLYGEARIPQTPVNIPGYAPFLGHNVDEHDAQHGSTNPASFTDQVITADSSLGSTIGAMASEHDFLNPGLINFFNEDEDVGQRSRGTTEGVNADSSQGVELQLEDSPYVPIGFRTMPSLDEKPREMRRWGW